MRLTGTLDQRLTRTGAGWAVFAGFALLVAVWLTLGGLVLYERQSLGDRIKERNELLARVFAWDDKAKAWETQPVAVSDRVVFGKGKVWQHTVTLLAAKGSDRSKAWKAGPPALPEGRYLVRVYVDADDRLKKDWKAELTDADFAGEAEFRGRWREGYGAMTTVDARQVKK